MFDTKTVNPYGVLNLQLKTTPLTADEERALEEALVVAPQLRIPIKPMTMVRAIVRADELYRTKFHKEPPHYGSDFWNIVFEIFFGHPPRSTEDKLWNILLFADKSAGRRMGALTYAEKLRKRGII